MNRRPAAGPRQLGPLTLTNPVIKAATFEGLSPGGHVSDALIDWHARIARGGAAMTTLAYGAVEPDGRTFEDQLLLDADRTPGLRRFTDAIHAAGAAAAVQLAHCGGFSRLTAHRPWGPWGPSPGWNLYGVALGLPRIRPMPESRVLGTIDAFARAATVAVNAGFDAVEVHLGHGYLLHQFLSARTNRRTDAWGGDADRRQALPRAVLRAVRAAIGPQRAMLTKLNLSDAIAGGVTPDDAIRHAQMALDAGCDGVVLSCGLVDRTPFSLLRGDVPVSEMARYERAPLQKLALRAFAPMVIRRFPYEDLFLLPEARLVRAAVDGPLILLGGVTRGEHLDVASAEGFTAVQVGRALIHDPSLATRWLEDSGAASGCTHCNRCVAEMEHEGARCVIR